MHTRPVARGPLSPSRAALSVATVVATLTLVLASVVFASISARADTSPPNPSTPVTVSDDALPTVQINGVVWTQLVVGNTVYAGGNFTSARPAGSPAGTNEVAKTSILAYNLSTGAMIASFNPVLNGQVYSIAVSPDGSRIYIGGTFTTVNGVNKYRIAALDPTTGALLSSFTPGTNSAVRAIVASGNTVYFGGNFTAVGSSTRNRLAAVNATTSALLPWAPSADNNQVTAMVISPDASKLVIGGNFTSFGGSTSPGYGLAMVDATSGASLPLPINSLVRDAGSHSSIESLSSDSTSFYGSGYVFGAGGNLEGIFQASWVDGSLVWVEDCHGDTYSQAPMGNVVYGTGHTHYCGNIGGFPQTNPTWTYHRALAFTKAVTQTITADPYGYYNFAGTPAPSLLDWNPNINTGTFTGETQGAWSVATGSQYVVYGGEFTQVNGQAQQGLVRFAVPSIAPNKMGPALSGGQFVPTLSSTVSGQVRVNWLANWDPDNENLTYSVYRDGSSTPIYTTTALSWPWQRPALGFVDTGLTPGATVGYRVRATDPFGNTVIGDGANITVSSATTMSSFAHDVLSQGASDFWRLDEAAGPTVHDTAGPSDAVASSGVSFGAPGAITGDPDTAVTMPGNYSQLITTNNYGPGPQTFSIGTWFTTTSTRGGKLVDFGDSNLSNSANTANSKRYDRNLYLDASGHVIFGVAPNGSRATVTSSKTYRDGAWHQAVATLGAGGMSLYVDGALVASNPNVTAAWAISGYWRIGGDNTWSGAQWFTGGVDDVAIFPTALTPAQVAAQYSDGVNGGTVPVNRPPTASFTSSSSKLNAAFDGSASSDPDGSIASYAWNFGDGSTGSGVTASHAYAASGTYQVTLTVTDNAGATASVTNPITVTQPANQPPVASFTASSSGLTVAVDGSASSDPDGTIAAYAWNFGDGSSSSGATASHTYASGGTYPVTLTVTDNSGATATATKAVTVTNANAPFAADAFGRTVSSGWGTADVGGSWTPLGSAAALTVANGAGAIALAAPSTTAGAYLLGATASSTDLTEQVSLDKVPTGGGAYVYVIGRHISNTAEYRANLHFYSNGTVGLVITAYRDSSSGVNLVSEVTLPFTYTAGAKVDVELQIVGSSPTTVQAKGWLDSGAQPTAWTVSATDSYSTLQAAGSTGVAGYLSGSATNAPVTISVRNLTARTP